MKLTNKLNNFFYLYEKSCDKGFIKDNNYSFGNLALFVDYYYNKTNWKKIYNELIKYIRLNNYNNFNIIIANGLFNISEKYGIGNCIDYRINRIKRDYRNKKLKDFNIFLDSYDYPKWVNQSLPYFNAFNYLNLYSKFSEDILRVKNKGSSINKETLSFFIKRLLRTKKIKYFICLFQITLYSDFSQFLYKVSEFIEKEYLITINKKIKDSPKYELELMYKKNKIIEMRLIHEQLYKENRLIDINYFSDEEHVYVNRFFN